MRVFDKIDNGKAGVIPSSKFVDLIETLGDGFCTNELAGNLRKVNQMKVVVWNIFTL